MRETTAPTIYVALSSIEAGLATFQAILDRAGLGDLFSPDDMLDQESGEVRPVSCKILPLVTLKDRGFLGRDWPDEGHVRIDIAVHRQLLKEATPAVPDKDGQVKAPAKVVDLGPHADVLVTLKAPEPWTALDLPPLFHKAALEAGPAVLDRPAEQGGPVQGLGNPSTIVALGPASPLYVYPTSAILDPAPAGDVPAPSAQE